MTSTAERRFKAFISYSHAADGRLAPALQRGLQLFTKPWYALRACRVFRDETTLTLTSELWPEIERAMLDSEFFLLLASPKAAESKWVAKEVTRWCEEREPRNILIVLTEGEIAWSDEAQDFDWQRTNALPQALSKKLTREPLYLDLRWAKTVEHLSPRHPRFLEAIADISCSLRGLSKDELLGQDVREHRRTRRIVQAVVLALLALTTVAIFASVQATRAREVAEQQRAVAEERRVQARGVAESIVYELDNALQGVPEATGARRVLSEKARDLLLALGTDESDFRIKRALMVQHSQRAEDASADGKFEVARDELLKSLALAKGLVGQDAMSTEFRRDLSVCLNKLVEVSTRLKDYAAAQQYAEQDVALTRELLLRDPTSLRYRNDLALSLEKLGKACLAKGDRACASKSLAEDVKIMRELHAGYPTNADVDRGLGIALIEHSELMLQEGNLDPAKDGFREALGVLKQLDEEKPGDARVERDMSVAHLKLGDIAQRRDKLADAQAAYEEAASLRRRLLARSPANPAAQRDLTFALGWLGTVQTMRGEQEAGIKSLEEAIKVQTALVERDATDLEMQQDLGVNLFQLAGALIEEKRFPEAQKHLTKCIAILRGIPLGYANGATSGLELINALRRSGRVELHLKNGPLAATLHREACGLIRAFKDGADAAITYDLTWTLGEIAKVHIDSPVGDRDVARQCAVEALRRLDLIRTDKRVQDDRDLKVMEGDLRRFLASKSP